MESTKKLKMASKKSDSKNDVNENMQVFRKIRCDTLNTLEGIKFFLERTVPTNQKTFSLFLYSQTRSIYS